MPKSLTLSQAGVRAALKEWLNFSAVFWNDRLKNCRREGINLGECAATLLVEDSTSHPPLAIGSMQMEMRRG